MGTVICIPHPFGGYTWATEADWRLLRDIYDLEEVALSRLLPRPLIICALLLEPV